MAHDFTIEQLLRLADHTPQLVGKLDCQPPAEVTIEVWQCSASGVTPVPVSSDVCYAIGDTGRWGWSTAHLQNSAVTKRPTFFYRMRASNGNEFTGQFFLYEDGDQPGPLRRARKRH